MRHPVLLNVLVLILAAALCRADEGVDAGPADRAIVEAIEAGNIPGGVLLTGTAQRVHSTSWHGNRQRLPDARPMERDTIFDLASLTKPVATATSVLILADRGDIDLAEPVATYIPSFGNNGKKAITVEQLLRHRGGLAPANPMSDFDHGPDAAWQAILDGEPRWEPGTQFAYSDVGFIVLGKLVETVSGEPLDTFARANIFEPLGMNDTAFKSTADADRFAATTRRGDSFLLGEVHDPRAHRLGGVAGHAGLFGTANDLSRWVRMLLNGGELDGTRVLSSGMVERMLEGVPMPDGRNRRGLGVDVDSGYSPAPRGERFAVGTTFGHTGYTGGCFWADPQNGAFYILLTNRVHPDDSGKVSGVRRAVATAVASQLLGDEPTTPDVLLGLDVLKRDGFRQFAGKRLAIVTNHTGLDRDGNHIVQLLANAENVDVVKLFSPEHGLYGKLDTKVGDMVDPETGLPVFSLYGETRKPSAEMLDGVDAIVFDIQDIGARFYTYISTMGLCMEAAKENGVEVIVLDRPNPINGVDVAGPISDEKYQGFTAFRALPLRHGMTVGELAKMFNDEIGCELTVVPVEGWRRDMWWDETGLLWTNPSPNMRNLTQATIYTAIGQLESGRQISCGRGTDQPFEFFGAPWINPRELAAALNARNIPGLRFVPIRFTPTERHYRGQECGGCYVLVTDRDALEPVSAGLTIAWTIEHLYPDEYNEQSVANMIQDDATMAEMTSTDDPATIPEVWQEELADFMQIRERFLMYQ